MRRNEAFSLRKSSTGLHQPVFASWAIQASSFQSANLKKPTRRRSKARILFKLDGRTKMLGWKEVFQNHNCVAHFHLPFRSFQKLVCLPHLSRKNTVPVFNFAWGLCFRRVVTQRGRLPSLIFCLEISACSRCKKGFVFPLGEMPS